MRIATPRRCRRADARGFQSRSFLVLGRPALDGERDVPAHLIEIKALVKHFGPIEAVRGVSFTVNRGEVLGFLGPNGAGKSTTMKMIAGFLTPTAGTAVICGHDVIQDPIAAKKCLGYLPEGAPAYPDMTAIGFLDFVARIRGFAGPEKKRRMQAAIDRVELGEVLHQPIETLSKGFKRRVGLAQALLHDPEVLILDEPTDGLDPNQKHQVRTLIQSMAAGKAIIISTHILEEVDAVCTRAMVIAKGKVLADGTPEALEARSRYHHSVYLRAASALPDGVIEALKGLPGVAAVEAAERAQDRGIYVIPAGDVDLLPAVRDLAQRQGLALDELRLERGRLDGVFRDITTAAA
jgi:ABC-2 type transport system ATP-binding protein